MDVTTALLCDFAQVREGVLFICSGGVSRLRRSAVPAPMGVALALVIEMDQIEGERPHELQVYVTGEDGVRSAEIDAGIQLDTQGLAVGEKASIPVALDLRLVSLPSTGPYDVGIYVDGQHRRTLSCRLEVRADPLPGLQ